MSRQRERWDERQWRTTRWQRLDLKTSRDSDANTQRTTGHTTTSANENVFRSTSGCVVIRAAGQKLRLRRSCVLQEDSVGEKHLDLPPQTDPEELQKRDESLQVDVSSCTM